MRWLPRNNVKLDVRVIACRVSAKPLQNGCKLFPMWFVDIDKVFEMMLYSNLKYVPANRICEVWEVFKLYIIPLTGTYYSLIALV